MNFLGQLLFIYSLIFLAISPWSTSTCFFDVVISLLLKYETRPFTTTKGVPVCQVISLDCESMKGVHVCQVISLDCE